MAICYCKIHGASSEYYANKSDKKDKKHGFTHIEQKVTN